MVGISSTTYWRKLQGHISRTLAIFMYAVDADLPLVQDLVDVS